VNREKQPELTEWDFDIPPDNRFHDPFRWQDRDIRCSDDSAAGSDTSRTRAPKEK
jgi:hypothetical protein